MNSIAPPGTQILVGGSWLRAFPSREFIRQALLSCLALAALFVAPSTGLGDTPKRPAPPQTAVRFEGKDFDLADSKERTALLAALDERIKLARKQRDDRRNNAETKPEKGKPQPEISSKARRGMEDMRRTLDSLERGRTAQEPALWRVREVADAIRLEETRIYIWRHSLDLAELVTRTRATLLNACGRGSARNPASNLMDADAADLSKVDPRESTFWARPKSIEALDLYHGFGRTAIPAISKEIVEYDAPHTGYGFHASFDARWGDEPWKVKFGEERTEPFGVRIMWALGYPALATDFAPEIKVRWNRRMLIEFNSRSLNTIDVKFLGLQLARNTDRVYLDPLRYIRTVVMKDGSRISARELKAGLFPARVGSKRPKHPETEEASYDKEFESKIDYLVMNEANIRSRGSKDEGENLGYWDYNALDHPKLRELRGLGVLFAWMDNWDVRWGNTRLRLVPSSNGGTQLEHVASDLGALFGNSTGYFRLIGSHPAMGFIPDNINAFSWVFTNRPAGKQGAVPIKYYMPVTRVQPFYEMNMDDARWMARLIAQLTENQLKQAIIGAGYDAAQGRLLLEKLVSRRDSMVADLGLGAEIPPLRANGANRKLAYDPRTDGAFSARVAGGVVTAADSGAYIVGDGQLKQRTHVKSRPT